MKKLLALLLVCCLLTACSNVPAETTPSGTTPDSITQPPTAPEMAPQLEGNVVDILLDGQTVTVGGQAATEVGAVCISRDIVYYEQKTHYESGNPYGEGGEADMHSPEEAAAHLVVNITAPGTYRLSGRLDKGQIRIDLGEDAYDDPDAVVNLILDGVEITCTVGPAILFQNVYECDGSWSTDTAKPDVDTTAAGANLILAENSENIVNGSYVAKIYKDKEGEKKLWKQDGAVYSYMSMNVYGPGSLDIHAENEGLDTELHLTICGGSITIRSGNDGINTNEDGVSVTTILGGNLRIIAGLGEEGDGIDSNGYLVIRGGTVVSAANPAADAGLDSDLGSYIHGGTVIALGSTMDWAESDSDQVTMNLQFNRQQSAGTSLVVAREDGTVVFAYDPSADEILGQNARQYMGAVISCPNFALGETYRVVMGAVISGSGTAGLYTAATGYEGGALQAYTGTDVMGHGGPVPGGMGIPEGVITPGEMPQPPEGDYTIPPEPGEDMPMVPQGNPPDGMGQRPSEGQEPPEDWTMPSMPEGQEPPGGFGGFGGFGGTGAQQGEARIDFYMQDKVNFFSGLTDAQ